MAKSAVVQVFRASCLEQDWNENQARIGLILTIYGTSLVAQLVESACNVGDLGLIPGLGRSPGEQKGYPLQYSALENSMDSIVHEVAKSGTRLGDFHFHLLQYSCLENVSWSIFRLSKAGEDGDRG